jgi:7-carboxy-7-deazaguanine synthase
MFGNNPKRKAEKGDGSSLFIQNIFLTFQGEGPFAGYPSIFIRLGGCNLACSFCDTEFESFQEMTLKSVLQKTIELSAGKKLLAVITGGEPFRQPIEKLCQELLSLGMEVQIETNGTLYREIDKKVSIICSPKNTGNGYGRMVNIPLDRVKAFKFLISASDDKYFSVPEMGQSILSTPVYVQPMDEYDPIKNQNNIRKTLEIATMFGYRLSIQIHKIIGIE